MDVQGDGDTTPNPSQSSQGDLERQDFEVITHFFASGGGGDDDDDERVWQELEKHVCIVIVLEPLTKQLHFSNHAGLPVHGLNIMQPIRSRFMPVLRS